MTHRMRTNWADDPTAATDPDADGAAFAVAARTLGRPSPRCRCDDNALSDNALAETPSEARSIAHCQSLLPGAAFARSLPTAPIIQSHASRNGIACTSSLAHILFCSTYASEW